MKLYLVMIMLILLGLALFLPNSTYDVCTSNNSYSKWESIGENKYYCNLEESVKYCNNVSNSRCYYSSSYNDEYLSYKLSIYIILFLLLIYNSLFKKKILILYIILFIFVILLVFIINRFLFLLLGYLLITALCLNIMR